MRGQGSGQGLTVQVIAGTHTVLIGFDLEDPSGCLGFGLQRTDHTDDEVYWLRGMKTFKSVVLNPAPGTDFSQRYQPIQGFQWGDYTAKPEHEYTYKVVAFGGPPNTLTSLAEVSVDVKTEPEDDGAHGIWFNRGIAGSQAYVKHFGESTPPVGAAEDGPEFAWLSRGLGEAFVAFVGQAIDADWGLRGAFYEFTWQTGLKALADAVNAGADVSLIVHGRDKDAAGGADKDHTAADNRASVTEAGLDPAVTWRTAANSSALQHNKFLVLTHLGQAVAVWTGSTNLTQGAVFGHLNVGHLIHDPAVAQQFLDYWGELEDQTHTTATMRTWSEAHNQIDLTAEPAPGMTTVFSPRTTTSTLLTWYATIFDGATSSAHITGAFGLNKVFRDKLGVDRDVVRTVLLDQEPHINEGIPTVDSDVRVSWGDYVHQPLFDRWVQEHLTNFNVWVKFIHTKIILVDPLTTTPTIITGSANYSDNSTTDNEENSVLLRGNGSDAVQRVADIYLTEYQRLFMHFVFRDWINRPPVDPGVAPQAGPGTPYLIEDDTWSDRYYVPGSWPARQRQTFAGTLG